jgi:hypothetical protein
MYDSLHNAKPIRRYFGRRFAYVFPNSLDGLFWWGYGLLPTRGGRAGIKDPKPKGFKRYTYRELPPMRRKSVDSWGEALETFPVIRGWLDGGLMFLPPADWSIPVPAHWPEHIKPRDIYRSFGANTLGKNSMDVYNAKWQAMYGVSELMAYVYGLPISLEEIRKATKGMAALLETRQFLLWAYNVPTILALSMEAYDTREGVRAAARFSYDPLSLENHHLDLIISPWLKTRPDIVACSGKFFNPTRGARESYLVPEGLTPKSRGPHTAGRPHYEEVPKRRLTERQVERADPDLPESLVTGGVGALGRKGSVNHPFRGRRKNP